VVYAAGCDVDEHRVHVGGGADRVDVSVDWFEGVGELFGVGFGAEGDDGEADLPVGVGGRPARAAVRWRSSRSSWLRPSVNRITWLGMPGGRRLCALW
jgi:hypothetical protein